MRYGRVIGLLTGLLAFCWALEASAGWMSAFSGYSAFAQGSTDGYVSFAVWEDTLSGVSAYVWNDKDKKFELGSLTGQYVYLYQVVNAQTGSSGLSWFRIDDDPGAFLQKGYLKKNSTNGVVFQDSEGNVGSSSNPTLGKLNQSVTDDVVDGKPTLSDATPSGLAEDSTTVFPTGMLFGSPEAYVEWTFPYINQGNTSTILFLTSNLPPSYRKSREHDTDQDADCDVPATPEPGTLIGLATLALAGGGLRLVRRRKA